MEQRGQMRPKIEIDEIEDFNSTVEEAGLDRSDFELERQLRPLPEGGIGVPADVVTVLHRPTKVKRVYRQATWVNDLHRDVSAGVFR